MFRRRPPRRPRAGPVPPAVREAERLFRQGRYKQAAQRFEALAQAAAQRGRWPAAARLHLRAGQCLLSLDQVDPALDHARRALAAMVRAGRPGPARQMFRQIIQALEQRGYHAQAEALRQEVKERLAAVGGPPGRRPRRYELPTNCPNCSAALKPEEYRQVRPDAVECRYCGSLVQAKAVES